MKAGDGQSDPCDNQSVCNDMEEDIAVKDDTKTEASADNNVIVIDDETPDSKSKQEVGSPTDTIYIDDNSDAGNEVVRPKVDFSHTQFP